MPPYRGRPVYQGSLLSWLTAAVLLAAVTACGAGAKPSTGARPTATSPSVPAGSTGARTPARTALPTAGTPPVSAQLEPCVTAPGRAFLLRTADRVQLSAAEYGAGSRGVVLVHEAGRRVLCGWVEYAGRLAASGYHVLLIDLRCWGRLQCPVPPAATGDNGVLIDVSGLCPACPWRSVGRPAGRLVRRLDRAGRGRAAAPVGGGCGQPQP